MSQRKVNVDQNVQTRPWGACIGDLAPLRDYLAEKNRFWMIFRLLDAFLRGVSQVVFANNPLSGLLIVIAVGIIAPVTLTFGVITGFLGLLLSMLVKEQESYVENGLTVLNPFLLGVMSSVKIPQLYGQLDGYAYLLLFVALIFCIYLNRTFSNDKFPCITWPFNLSGITLLFVLVTQSDHVKLPTTTNTVNTTVTGITNDTDVDVVLQNATDVNVNWGMVFRGMIVSASQLYMVDDVAVSAIIYLAIVVYSPITAAFSFFGAMLGTLTGLQLGVSLEEIFIGSWGYNSFLIGGSLGGNLFILNGQTAAATIVAIVYAVFVQYIIQLLFAKIGLPVLTFPFIVVCSIFLKLREPWESAFIPQPLDISYPEEQRTMYFAYKRNTEETAVHIEAN